MEHKFSFNKNLSPFFTKKIRKALQVCVFKCKLDFFFYFCKKKKPLFVHLVVVSWLKVGPLLLFFLFHFQLGVFSYVKFGGGVLSNVKLKQTYKKVNCYNNQSLTTC